MADKPNEPSGVADVLTRLAFALHENRGVYALLLGSGLSRAAGIPTGWEITLDLIQCVGTARGVGEQADWAAWYRKEVGREPDYSELVTELGRKPDERRAVLGQYIEGKTPTPAHGAIADLVKDGFVRVIVTTNFDRLLENALRERGVEPTVVASEDAIHGAEPLAHTACYVVKLHGDYKDARIRNTEAELSEYGPELAALLERILDEHGLLVCGWSGEWDEALRSAIMRSRSRRYSLFWAARGELGDAGFRIVQHHRGQVIPIADADGFFGGLRDRVQTLARTRQQEPRTVELLVNSAKRFVSRPEHRVELDDLVESEAARLQGRLREFRPVGGLDLVGIRARIDFHESAAEPLARVAGALGRWGDGGDVAIATNALDALVAQADEVGSGIVQLLALRAYSAVLALTAYGLGLTHAKRWDALYRVLLHPIAKSHTGRTRVVDRLFLWSWDGAESTIWKQLPELARNRTPFSDHVRNVMDEWRASFAAVVPDFDVLYVSGHSRP